MNRILTTTLALGRDRRGVTALEYALIAAFTAVAIAGVLALLGPRLSGVFQTIVNALPSV
ncbi:Flp family type IVb pilin [Roseococcus sp. DSY-14]|uniref:Flp family type IVb pilin n=1 Tax=Roseococcus sp. DSY-14 TaxID=3369650 RepID=UPI00387B2FD8